MKYILVYMYREAASQGEKQGIKTPTMEQLINPDLKTMQFGVYWEQYRIETQDWYLLSEASKNIKIDNILVNKKIRTFLSELKKLVDIGSSVEEQVAMLLDLAIAVLIWILAPRRAGNELLIPQTWSRHALLNEVVNQVEKIFIYNKKLLNKEQKKNLFLFSLEVLEQLVKHDYIKQELVETTGHLGERLVAVVGAEQHEEYTLPKKKTNKQAAYKTFFNYKLKAKIELPLNFSYWNISLIPTTEILFGDGSIYIRSATLKTIHKVTLENRYSEKHIVLENITVVNKLKDLRVYLNTELYELVQQALGHTKSTPTIKQILDEIREDIKQLRQPIYKTKGVNEKGSRESWIIDSKKTHIKWKALQRRINKQLILLDFVILGGFLSYFNRPLYFYYMLDFRGRLYYKSKISPQNTYIFRYIYDYGLCECEELTTTALPINYSYWYELIAKTLGLKRNYTEGEQRSIFWLIIEHAKLYKSNFKIGKDGVISIGELVELGLIAITQKPETSLTQEKTLQKNYIQHVFNELLEQKTPKRRYIVYKDATASAIQLLTLYLIPSSEEVAKYANLKSITHWYDTYHYIIQLYLKKYKINEDSIPYFTRSNLKKTIMTYNYSATLFTCWQEFEFSLKEQELQINNKQLQNIKTDFKQFYAFLDELFNKQSIFINSLDALVQSLLGTYNLQKAITMQSADKATIYLHYQENNLKRWTLQKNKLRKTIQVQELKEKLDVKKTKQSIKPNTTHAMDAALVRETLGDLRQPIITIHDCYGTDIMRIDEVIYSINKNINRVEKTELKKDREHWFSIFIVL